MERTIHGTIPVQNHADSIPGDSGFLLDGLTGGERSSRKSFLVRFTAKDFFSFIKLRLTFLVVFSGAVGYLLAPAGKSILDMLFSRDFWIMISGLFLVISASNGLNEVFERDKDSLMNRTKNRPLPASRLSMREGIILSLFLLLSGALLLYIISPLSMFLALLALVLYVFAYTPLKRYTAFCTLVGAFPGSIPVLIGWVSAYGALSTGAWLLFAIQFIWQFPHFWSIAWVCDSDYKRAGFRMLPSNERDRRSAYHNMLYTLALIPVSMLPSIYHLTGVFSLIVSCIASLVFAAVSFSLFHTISVQSAKRLMFSSFVYLPLVFLGMLFDKV